MRRGSGAGALAALVAAVVFGAALLLSLTAGASVYRQVQDRADRAASRRLGLTYITAKLHGADAAGGVAVGSFGGSDAVFLLRELDGTEYRTALYVYDGALRELFSAADAPLGPEAGQVVTEARGLEVSESDGLLTLRYTDGTGHEETARVFLRSTR